MNAKRNSPFKLILAALSVIVAYFLLFPYPMGRETVPAQGWALETGGQPADAAELREEGTAAPFRLGNEFGYVSGDGRLLYRANPLFQVALTDAGFINFARMGSTWFFQNTRGERVFSFSGSGYPLLGPGARRIFTVSADLTGMREYDANGEPLWSRDFPSLITCLSVRPDHLLVGLLDGSLELVGGKGEKLADCAPGGSRIPVILGCAVSEDGRRFAAVSGVDGQLLVVWEKKGPDYREAARIPLDSDFRREARMEFSPDGSYLIVEGPSSANLYDSSSRRMSSVPLSGSLEGFAFLRDGACAFIAGAGSARELVICRPFSPPLLRETFRAGAVSLGAVEGAALLGADGVLLRIDLKEM